MGTQLYLIRHGIAEERGPSWPDDDLRPLTDIGARRVAAIAAGLARIDAAPDRILTSPLRRAKSTADIVAEAVKPRPTVQETAALSPGHTPAEVIRRLKIEEGQGVIALVGHEPDLGLLAAHLIGANRPLPFKKGAVCRIDLTTRSSAGTLVWFLPPSVLRRLGR